MVDCGLWLMSLKLTKKQRKAISEEMLLLGFNDLGGTKTMTLQEFQHKMDRLHHWAKHGCLDGGCQIERPKGQHTNGGCRCSPRAFSNHLLELAAQLEGMGKHAR